jgi:cytoskeletal protein RodZ
LKRHREASGKSLEDIARTTRISKRYLEAFEASDLKNFPESAFAKGFLRNYACEVGLDVEECFQRYDQFVRSLIPTQIKDVRKLQKQGFSLEPKASWAKQNWAIPAVAGIAALVFVLVIIGFIVFKLFDSTPDASSPDLSGTGAPGVEMTTPEGEAPPPDRVMTKPSVLEIRSDTRLRLIIRLDESAAQEIIIEPGEQKAFEVFRQVEIQGVDQVGLALSYNGQALEVAGPSLKLFNRFLFSD